MNEPNTLSVSLHKPGKACQERTLYIIGPIFEVNESECHYAECVYAECVCAECVYAECVYAVCV